MFERELGQTGLNVTAIGFGAFKIGRNEKAKYPQSYDLPDDAAVDGLLNRLLDMGVNYIDTAPAYGISEQRIGQAIAHRRSEFVLSTKVGETFENGRSNYDFSASAVRLSVERSLKRLRTEQLDLVFVHSNGDDQNILENTDVVSTLQALKAGGLVRAIGFSGKAASAAQAALSWADAIMVEYNSNDTSHTDVMTTAADHGVGVIVKKGLASGHLPAAESIAFVLRHPAVSSLVIGGLNADHFQSNVEAAQRILACTP